MKTTSKLMNKNQLLHSKEAVKTIRVELRNLQLRINGLFPELDYLESVLDSEIKKGEKA